MKIKWIVIVLGLVILLGLSQEAHSEQVAAAQDSDSNWRFAIEMDSSGYAARMIAYSLDTQTSQIIWNGEGGLAEICEQVAPDTVLMWLDNGSLLSVTPESALEIAMSEEVREQIAAGHVYLAVIHHPYVVLAIGHNFSNVMD